MQHEKILIVDDEPKLMSLIKRLLELESFKVFTAESGAAALEAAKNNNISIIISDIKLPDINGLDLIAPIKKLLPGSEIIMLTAYGKIEDGVKAVKAGAFDYLVKGDEDNRIILAVKKAHEKLNLTARIARYERNFVTRYSFNNITGSSPLITEAVNIARKAAAATTPILLTGETGTGKEVFAQAVHYQSPRSSEPFVAINCSGFAKDLLESEMFGYKAGAFTGAVKNKKGLFEEADKGTLFLDEIGDMDLALQAKLLRVLETNTFIKQGDTKETSVDVRIIAASNRDIKTLIENGGFRSDLYYRIGVIQISLPPLRSRQADIPLLTDDFVMLFCKKFKKDIPKLHNSFYDTLSRYHFPGNIRELKNIIERIILLNDKPVLTGADLPNDLFTRQLSVNGAESDITLSGVEKKHILSVLASTGNNKAEAAALLGIGLTTLYRKLNDYGISAG